MLTHRCLFSAVPSRSQEVPFAASLLLPISLDASLLADPDFVVAAPYGYNCYFGERYRPAEEGQLLFVDHFFTWGEVEHYLSETMAAKSGKMVCMSLYQYIPSSLAWRAGFLLGWLSALALVQGALASCGIALLLCLVNAWMQ